MNIKRAIKPIFEATSDIPHIVLPVAVNDFGLRGGTLYDGAAIGGMAHLVHFRGSDNMPASMLLKDFYNYKGRALSVWATEHSVATSYGPEKGEYEYIKAQLSVHKDKIKSIVIDSYNADNFVQNIVGSEEIKKLIIEHEGRIVLRPDTGKPLTNVCKYSDILGGIFGFDINSKGYKVIKHNIGLIQGDGMDEKSIPELYREYIKTGWAADNIITGSGGGLLEEGLTRDTNRWAVKASYGEKDGVPFDIRKTPAGDMSKASKGGMLKLHSKGTTIESSKESKVQFDGYADIMQTVYENGNFYPDNFENIIKRAEKW
jgi:nicotinamide phosphoribosyltransferase